MEERKDPLQLIADIANNALDKLYSYALSEEEDYTTPQFWVSGDINPDGRVEALVIDDDPNMPLPTYGVYVPGKGWYDGVSVEGKPLNVVAWMVPEYPDWIMKIIEGEEEEK